MKSLIVDKFNTKTCLSSKHRTVLTKFLLIKIFLKIELMTNLFIIVFFLNYRILSYKKELQTTINKSKLWENYLNYFLINYRYKILFFKLKLLNRYYFV